MFWPVFKNDYYFDPLYKNRGFLFWLTLPIQMLAALIMFPLAMLLSFADIKEESNNHLIILTKK
jgi:hypothetical protein